MTTATPNFEVKIARCFAFVGPLLPLDANFAIGNFIRDALRGGPIRIAGDGTPFRSYLYAADLAIWLWTILFKGNPAIHITLALENDFNIGPLAKTVAESSAPKLKIVVDKNPLSGQLAQRYVPSIQRARHELGLDVMDKSLRGHPSDDELLYR